MRCLFGFRSSDKAIKMQECFGNAKIVITRCPNSVQLLLVLAFTTLTICSDDAERCTPDGSNGIRCIRDADSSRWNTSCSTSRRNDCGRPDLYCVNSKCACTYSSQFYNGKKNACENPGRFGEECSNEPADTCQKNLHIACNSATSKCECDPGSTPYTLSTCGELRKIGESCGRSYNYNEDCPKCPK